MTERTEEDYAEIMVGLKRFLERPMWMTVRDPDGTERTGAIVIYGDIMWVGECLKNPHPTPPDFGIKHHPISGPSYPVGLCSKTRIEIWDSGFRKTGHGFTKTCYLIES